MNQLDDLELELRKLPGVKAAGFDEREDMLIVQLHVGDKIDSPEHPVPIEASRIVARHVEERTAVEIVRWRAIPGAATAVDVPAPAPAPAPPPPVAPTPEPEGAAVAEPTTDDGLGEEVSEGRRARLLAVLSFPDTDELEVHLIHDGRRTIGRAPASRGLVGAVEATIEAVRGLGAPIDPRAKWARAIDSNGDGRELVAVALAQENEVTTMQYGLAAGASAIDAAARSTLDALNRQLSRVL